MARRTPINHASTHAAGGTDPITGGAPTTADYLVRTADAGLSAERVVTDTAAIAVDWGTAGQAKFNLVDTAVTPGTYGSATQVPQVTFDADGRCTGAANVAINTAVGGDSSGTLAAMVNDQARGLRETAGPTTLAMGAVTDTHSLTRSGATIIGVLKQNYHAFLAAIAALTLTNGQVLQAAGGTVVADYATDAYGDGSDGALAFDGAATILGVAPVANVYTMTRDFMATNVTISSGVTVIMPNFIPYANGTLTFTDSTSIIAYNGNAASGTTGGVVISAAGSLSSTGGAGPNGRSTTGVGANAIAPGNGVGAAGGAGGAGGSAGGTSTVSAPSTTLGSSRVLDYVMRRMRFLNSNALNNSGGGVGGGAGGCTTGVGTASSGGGGGGAPNLLIFARYIAGAGTIRTKGGVGGNGAFTGVGVAGGGGGGGGGRIMIVTATPSQPATLDVSGGAGGLGAGGGSDGVVGGTGSTVVLRVA